jgi:hypothetical protein
VGAEIGPSHSRRLFGVSSGSSLLCRAAIFRLPRLGAGKKRVKQHDRFASADSRSVVLRVKFSVNRINLRRSGYYVAGNIGNTTESTRVFSLSNVRRQDSRFSGQVTRAEAAHDAVRMADRVFAFDERFIPSKQ